MRGGEGIMTQTGAQPALPDTVVSGRYEGVGHSLKVVRERRGLTLAEVSARLRIRRPYLEAIESGAFGELPGAVYISGFLRQYAEFLGLEAEQVLKNYQAEADAPLRRTVLNFPMPRPEERTPRLWLVIGALVLAAIVYVLWYRHQEALRFGQDLIQAVPARLADLVPSPQPIAPAPQPALPSLPVAAPQPAEAPASGPAAVATAPAAPAPPGPAETTAAVAPAAPPVVAAPPTVAPALPAPAAPPVAGTDSPAETPAVPTGSAQQPGTYGVPETESRIRVEATAPAWVQVRGPNNEQVFTRLLNKGERYIVPDRAGLTLLTGNAGGVRLVIDGHQLPPLGADGEVKRGISLDPERLKSGDQERQG